MGYEANDAAIVVIPDYVMGEYAKTMQDRLPDSPVAPDVEAFRQSIPEEYRGLLVGPIPNVVNGGVWWVFGPDGSKEGWSTSDEAEEWRARFMALFSFTYEDGSSPYDVVHVRWGSDHAHEVGASIEYANDEHHDAAIAATWKAACETAVR